MQAKGECSREISGKRAAKLLILCCFYIYITIILYIIREVVHLDNSGVNGFELTPALLFNNQSGPLQFLFLWLATS